MVNPVGPAPERESVVLINASPNPVDLTDWRIADRLKRTSELPGGALAAGQTLHVMLTGDAQLGNSGGSITVIDRSGLKIDGVSYTAAQAQREGWTIVS